MNKRKKLLLVAALLFLLTGCTQYKTYNNEPVIIDSTGQRVVENILCKTEETERQFNELKEKYKIDLDNQLNDSTISQEEYDQKLAELNENFDLSDVAVCSEFNVFSGDEGLWTTLFVKTLAWLITKIGMFTQNYGWAIIIVTILIRLVLYPLTQKTAMQSENLNAAKSKLDKLELKYRNRNDQQSQMLKAQEMMTIYKQYNINPMSGCLYALIQIPLFFAFYEALYRLPVVLEENFFGINLGITPLTAFQHGQYYYLIFVALVILATYFSFKLNTTMNPSGEQAKQMKMMMNISIVMISIASFTISTGIALYWIVNSSFTIVQNLIAKRSKKNEHIA